MRGGGIVWDMSSTCVQGGLPRPLGGYQPNLIMEPHSPSPAWQMHHPKVPKREPMDEDRNDSGTGSDFHSASPGSENGHEYNPPPIYSPQSSQNHQTTPYYPGPLVPRIPPSSMGYSPVYQVTSPARSELSSSPPMKAPSPSYKPPEGEGEDPLKRLQYTLEKNGLSSSPKAGETSADDENKSDDGDEFDEQGLRVPRMNSHGKVKTHKCKQCDFVAITKLDFWEHSKQHIKPDKLLTCPRCPFVTEFKHHLEYHLRNHVGSKPFKCDKCSYACVNKSMLNSHMKSHSTVYQYRCSDCSYATKYCHSLKLHLRKYTHKPAMVLNPDGTPNPLPIIDVYGSRRGPKQKSLKLEEDMPNPLPHLARFMLNSPQMQLPFPYHFLAGFQNLPNPFFPLEDFAKKDAEQKETEEEKEDAPEVPQADSPPPPPEVLDLSKPEAPKNRRKGKAFKLEHLPVTSSDEEEEVRDSEAKEELINNNNNSCNFNCQYCNISFGDVVLYTMHMGYHGFNDPFTCNMCGEQCKDKVSFFLHIARNPHT